MGRHMTRADMDAIDDYSPDALPLICGCTK